MKKGLAILGLFFILLFQSCYFGGGLAEERLTGDIGLMAINSLDEAELIYQEKGTSVYYSLVPGLVFSVGYDDDFVIAKTHPVDSNGISRTLTYYHIIEVKKVSEDNHEKSPALTFKQFQRRREELNVPEELKFTIDLERTE
jgi:hypothetical protein